MTAGHSGSISRPGPLERWPTAIASLTVGSAFFASDPDMQRLPGSSGCNQSPPKSPSFRLRQGSNVSVRRHSGNFACTGASSDHSGVIRKAILRQVKHAAESEPLG
jgi:hypothetical protein